VFRGGLGCPFESETSRKAGGAACVLRPWSRVTASGLLALVRQRCDGFASSVATANWGLRPHAAPPALRDVAGHRWAERLLFLRSKAVLSSKLSRERKRSDAKRFDPPRRALFKAIWLDDSHTRRELPHCRYSSFFIDRFDTARINGMSAQIGVAISTPQTSTKRSRPPPVKNPESMAMTSASTAQTPPRISRTKNEPIALEIEGDEFCGTGFLQENGQLSFSIERVYRIAAMASIQPMHTAPPPRLTEWVSGRRRQSPLPQSGRASQRVHDTTLARQQQTPASVRRRTDTRSASPPTRRRKRT